MAAVDANFKAKNLIRSSDAKDPGLHTGLAYFVENEPYREHLLKHASQVDVRLFNMTAAHFVELTLSR